MPSNLILNEHSDTVLNQQHYNCTDLFSNESHDGLSSKRGIMLAPIFESTDSFGMSALEIHKETELSESSTAASSCASEDQRSLSETFVSLNRAFACLNTHNQTTRKSEQKKVTTSSNPLSQEQMRYTHHRTDEISLKSCQKSFQQHLVPVAIDFLPLLIGAIWAAAVLLSMSNRLS